MTKKFVITNFRGTYSSVEMLKGCMLIFRNAEGYIRLCRNAEGVDGKREVGNPCCNRTSTHSFLLLFSFSRQSIICCAT